MGVVPQLDNLDVSLTVEQNLLVFAHLYRVPARERKEAIERALEHRQPRRRAATSKVDELSGGMRRRLLIARALLHQPAPRPARRADRRPRPAGAPGAVGADRPAAHRGRLDPDEHALHRGGRAPLRRGDDHVPRQGRRRRRAARAHRRARRARGDRGLRLAGAARPRSRAIARDARLAHAPHRHVDLDPAAPTATPPTSTASAASPTSRTSSSCSPGRRSPDGRRPPPPPHRARRRLGRLERAALQGVMVREIVNFSSFWRSSTFSSTVDPTIYLLAFGFGFGSLVSKVAGYDYIDFVGTGIVATTVLFSRRVPGDVLDVRQVPVPAHLRRDPRRAGRHRGAGHRRGAVDRRADRGLRLRADARGHGLRARPELGHAARARSSPRWPASAGRASGSSSPAKSKAIESFSYWQSGLLTPMFLVAGTFFPLDELPTWAQIARQPQPAVPLRRARAPRGVRLRGLDRRLAPRRSWSASRWSPGAWRSASWSAS